MNDRLIQLETEVERLRARVQELSHDALTGLWGRGVLDHSLSTELARASRFGRPLGLLMIDIDHFKKVNDQHGHQAGDAVLRLAAHAMQSHIRKSDTIARYGGEEFCVIVDGASRHGVLVLANRIREAVEEAAIPGLPCVTVSIGTAVSIPNDSPQSILTRADVSLYKAKNAGRNRVGVPYGPHTRPTWTGTLDEAVNPDFPLHKRNAEDCFEDNDPEVDR